MNEFGHKEGVYMGEKVENGTGRLRVTWESGDLGCLGITTLKRP